VEVREGFRREEGTWKAYLASHDVFGVKSEVCRSGEAWLCAVVETESGGGVRWKCGEWKRSEGFIRRQIPLPTKRTAGIAGSKQHFKE
jgi:hypothetical protein